MSLRVFHIFFISLCVIFSFAAALWIVWSGDPQGILGWLGAFLCASFGGGLAVYGWRFLLKMRRLDETKHSAVALIVSGVFFTYSRELWACATCFGDPGAAQTRGMNWAVFSLLIVICSVLGAFVLFFFSLWRTALRYKEGKGT